MDIKNFIGKKFGTLTVTEYAYKKGSNHYFKCKCNCGGETLTRSSRLIRGETRSCRKCPHDNLVGQRFNRFLVIKYITRSTYLCRCDCGNERIIKSNLLKNNNTKSCGCYKKEEFRKRVFKHGASINKKSEYYIWVAMRQRCYNKKNKSYKNYGGRGIIICDRWNQSYEDFLSDMGKRPSTKHSIDRINNDGNYEPSNCRWATYSEQAFNRRPMTDETKNKISKTRIKKYSYKKEVTL